MGIEPRASYLTKLHAGALTTELQLSIATQAISLRMIDNLIPKLMLKQSTGIFKSPD